jgi:pimeloyl-ACP methyl ester carboxylesterase
MVVVFLHGWGVLDPDYGALPEWLRERLGASVVDIWLSDYVSNSDSVTMSDLVDAFERARRQNFPGVKFACVTHSTGGPLARQWLANYGASEDLLTHLVMLAPPHHGSALAQLGKGRLSRMALWFGHGEPGEQILNWLELGSLESWRLNCETRPSSSFQFSLIGSGIDAKLYDHLNSYTSERGSDGVVRAAAANLNYNLIELKQAGPQLRVIGKQRSAPSAFGILPGLSHCGSRMGILSSITRANASCHLTAQWVERCLRVATPEDYAEVSRQLRATLETVPERLSQVEGCMMVVRVKDGTGRPVRDFDLYLTGGPNYDPGDLPKNFFLDRQRNQVTPNALTYYVDHRVFQQTRELGLRIGARPQRGPVNYLAAEFRSEEATVAAILRPHETVMVDITLDRRLEQAVFQLRRAA